MKQLLRRYAILVALMLFWAPVSPAQTAPPKVQKIVIQHIGPQAANEDLIRANIRVKAGDSYLRTSVDDDVRTLYATGYFYNIRVGEERLPNSEVILTYVLQGKPMLTEIQFTGNKKYSRSSLLKKVTSKTNEPLDERKLFNDTQEILKKYQNAGYQKTLVKYALNIDERAGTGSVTFDVTEVPKVKVRRVDFEGATVFSTSKLRWKIKTNRWRWVNWMIGGGKLKDDQFEDDKEKLAEIYHEKGYIDFEIKDVKFNQITPHRMVIDIVLSEGRQYKVGSVKIEGNKLFPTEDILKGIMSEGKPIKPIMVVGQTFTPRGLIKDIEAIQDFYGAKGYIDTRVSAQKVPNVELGTMDLVYHIEELDKSFIEKVEIKGNVKTKDKVIRRELAVSPGETFDMVRVKLSKRRIEGLDFFEKVDTQPEPTDIPNRKNLIVGVEEKSTANFMVGAGFSSVDNLIGYVELSQGNFDLFNPPWFMGGGQKFRLRTTIGTQRKDYVATFIEPWFLDRKLALSVDLYHRELNYLSDQYDERMTGAQLGLTRALGSDNLLGTTYYKAESVGLVNVTDLAPDLVKNEKGYTTVTKFGVSLAYDTRNNAQVPTRGQRSAATVELAGPFGGEKNFYKLELESAWYFKGLYEDHRIEVGAKGGTVKEYGNTGRVPFFERYFLGGAYDVRGFKYRHVGPHDANGEPIGGNTYVFASLEYSVPVIERVRFAMFYDIGWVNEGAYSFDPSNYNDDWGLGIRLNIPGIGPLRFDYAFPIAAGQNSKNGRFQFSVSYNRPF